MTKLIEQTGIKVQHTTVHSNSKRPAWLICWKGSRISVPVLALVTSLSSMRKTGNSIGNYRNFRSD